MLILGSEHIQYQYHLFGSLYGLSFPLPVGWPSNIHIKGRYPLQSHPFLGNLFENLRWQEDRMAKDGFEPGVLFVKNNI